MFFRKCHRYGHRCILNRSIHVGSAHIVILILLPFYFWVMPQTQTEDIDVFETVGFTWVPHDIHGICTNHNVSDTSVSEWVSPLSVLEHLLYFSEKSLKGIEVFFSHLQIQELTVQEVGLSQTWGFYQWFLIWSIWVEGLEAIFKKFSGDVHVLLCSLFLLFMEVYCIFHEHLLFHNCW